MGGCAVDGCECAKIVGRGLCRKHYGRWHRTGSTDDAPRKRKPIEDRFWNKVEKAGDDECWLWAGTKNSRGYGSIGLGDRLVGKDMAHRVSYRLHYGEIPQGKWILHSCDNPSCVNPKHLRVGTPLENTADAISRARLVNPPKHDGENNCKAKMKIEDVEYVRAHPELKATFLAAQYGVNVSTIHNIVSGRTWRVFP